MKGICLVIPKGHVYDERLPRRGLFLSDLPCNHWIEYVQDLENALMELHAEVEMGEATGICLRDRVPSLRAGQLIGALAAREEAS